MNYILNNQTGEKKYFYNYRILNSFNSKYLSSQQLEVSFGKFKRIITIYEKDEDGLFYTDEKDFKVFLV